MDMGEYQKLAQAFMLYPEHEKITYPILGLNSEAGEVADKYKKIIRDKKGHISEEDRVEILKEVGDVLWYCAAICTDLNMPLHQAALMNIKKLNSRLSRDVIQGSGDNR